MPSPDSGDHLEVWGPRVRALHRKRPKIRNYTAHLNFTTTFRNGITSGNAVNVVPSADHNEQETAV